MKRPVVLLLVAALSVGATGCAAVNRVRLTKPGQSGMTAIAPDVHVDPAMEDRQRTTLLVALDEGRNRASDFYGGLVSRPALVACSTWDCYRHFGGSSPMGQQALNRMLVSPKGMSATIISHEWSHRELYERVGLRGWLRLPHWFDEGVAVLLSGDSRYTESAWIAATDNGRLAPGLDELKTLLDWWRSTRSDPTPTKQFSYGTAAREVRRWYAIAGRDGFRRLVEALRAGQDFRDAYERVERTEGRGSPPVETGGTR